MESSQNGLKSLKDTLLEYAVLNMDLLLKSEESKNGSASLPTFPSFLFDEILYWSRDMCWPSETWKLRPCIAARDKLKWGDTSFSRFFDDYNQSSFATCNLRLFKILKLRFDLYSKTDVNALNEILKTAEAVEKLDLVVKKPRDKEIKIEPFKPLRPSRVRLCLDSMDWFPSLLDPDNLTVLEFYGCNLTNTFPKLLVGLKRLVSLSLGNFTSDLFSMEGLIDAAASLKSLSYLNLWIFDQTIDELMLNKITTTMENLDVLEIWRIILNDPNLLLAPRKKLKVLNYRDLSSMSATLDTVALQRLSDRVGHLENLDGLLTVVSTSQSRRLCSEAVEKLLALENLDPKKLIEEENKGTFNFRSPVWLDETTTREPHDNVSYDALLRMICYGVSKDAKIRQLPFYKDWIKDFVERNKNTHLAKRFTRLLESI